MNNYLETLIDQQNRLIGQQNEALEINRQLLDAVRTFVNSVAPLPNQSKPILGADWCMDIEAAGRMITAPDPLAGQPDLVLSPAYAAQKLGRSDRQVARYRAQGKLAYVDDDGEGRSGYWLSQVRRLHFDLWGQWPQ